MSQEQLNQMEAKLLALEHTQREIQERLGSLQRSLDWTDKDHKRMTGDVVREIQQLAAAIERGTERVYKKVDIEHTSVRNLLLLRR